MRYSPGMAIFAPSAGHPVGDAPAVAARAFSRAARVSVAGLLIPPLVLMLASTADVSVPGGVRGMLAWVPVLAFSASGWLAVSPLGVRRPRAWWLVAGFTAAGLAVVPAYGSLQGLTGREPVSLVVGLVGGAFAAGFALAAMAGGHMLAAGGGAVWRLAVVGGLAGTAGSVCALLPYLAAATGLGPAGAYLRMPLAVIATLGCLIVPYRIVGSALGEAAARAEPT